MNHSQRFLALFAILAISLWPSPLDPLWVSTWTSSQQIPEPQNALPPDDLRDATVRQIFHLSLGGPALRVRLSNAFGTEALHFTSVHVARSLSPSSPAIDPSTDRALSFAGASDVTVPPGADFLSDSLDFSVAPLSDVAVTFYLESPPSRQSSHPGSRATSYYQHGNAVAAANLTEPKHVDHWFQISEIDVQASQDAASIVALGDSITDGHGATTNSNDRWTDVLALRLQTSPETRNIGVSNQGIGGNHLLTDGLGPNALARFDRDALAPAGVRWLSRRTCRRSEARPGCLSANHRASPRRRTPRLRRHHHAFCRLRLLPPQPSHGVRPPSRQ
jgi:hypothetical protein